MKVKFNRIYTEYPGAYISKLTPGIYIVGEDDDIIVVGKGGAAAISLKSLYVYGNDFFFGKVRPLGQNEVILSGD